MIDTEALLAKAAPVGEVTLELTSSHLSSAREKVLEYRFLADLSVELYRRGLVFDVLRSDVDAWGHDLVIEANGIVRHIQLKATYLGGKSTRVTSNMRLATRPSGCLVWMIYDPHTFGIIAFRWFGGVPGSPLPDLGTSVAKHSRGNGGGIKAARPAHRVLPSGPLLRSATWQHWSISCSVPCRAKIEPSRSDPVDHTHCHQLAAQYRICENSKARVYSSSGTSSGFNPEAAFSRAKPSGS